jgi:cardiolipin synthase A/B
MLAPLLDAWTDLLALPHMRAYLTGAYAAYLLGLGGWIVLQKREPVATISWLLGLALLPYVGFIVYQWLGPQRIRRHRLRRARSRAARVVPDDGDTGPARELSRLATATTALPQTSARDVRLLIDGAAKYTALLADIAQARESIDLEYYIFLPDRTGTALRDALVARGRTRPGSGPVLE